MAWNLPTYCIQSSKTLAHTLKMNNRIIPCQLQQSHLLVYSPSLLRDMNWGGGSFFLHTSDSCLHDLLPQRCDSEILSRLRRHSVYPIPLTKTTGNKYRPYLFTMPWLNISNRINKISLTALYIDVYWWLIVGGEVFEKIGLFAV